MKIVIAIAAAIVSFFVITLWSCLRVASKEDEQLEKMAKEQKK